MTTLHIPNGVEYSAEVTMNALLNRGLKHTEKLTVTCKQVAMIACSKAGIANRKIIRMLTNRLVSMAFDHAELR